MDTVTENTEEAVVRDGAYVPQPLALHGWGLPLARHAAGRGTRTQWRRLGGDTLGSLYFRWFVFEIFLKLFFWFLVGALQQVAVPSVPFPPRRAHTGPGARHPAPSAGGCPRHSDVRPERPPDDQQRPHPARLHHPEGRHRRVAPPPPPGATTVTAPALRGGASLQAPPYSDHLARDLPISTAVVFWLGHFSRPPHRPPAAGFAAMGGRPILNVRSPNGRICIRHK